MDILLNTYPQRAKEYHFNSSFYYIIIMAEQTQKVILQKYKYCFKTKLLSRKDKSIPNSYNKVLCMNVNTELQIGPFLPVLKHIN